MAGLIIAEFSIHPRKRLLILRDDAILQDCALTTQPQNPNCIARGGGGEEEEEEGCFLFRVDFPDFVQHLRSTEAVMSHLKVGKMKLLLFLRVIFLVSEPAFGQGERRKAMDSDQRCRGTSAENHWLFLLSPAIIPHQTV